MTVSHMKVTDTLNRPLRDLRISVTDRCNFRCSYCMPKEVFGRDWAFLPRAHLLSFEEIVRLARIFVDQGIEKIRLTGGEPLTRPDLSRLIEMLEGIAAAEAVGLKPIKINMVVKRGVNENSIVDMAHHFRHTNHIVRFIEYMDVGHSNDWRMEDVVSAAEILARIDAQWPLEPMAINYRGEVASRYRYRDGGGEIGLIASGTPPFSPRCTPARLTAE